MVEHGFYIIDDRFFEDFPDPYLKGNKEEKKLIISPSKIKKPGYTGLFP